MAKDKIVPISLIPAPRVLSPEGIGAANLGLANAIGEIVANCCDWHLLTEEEAESLREAAVNEPAAAIRLKALEQEYGSLGKVTSSEDRIVTIQIDKSNNPKITII